MPRPIDVFQKQHNVLLIPKESAWTMRVITYFYEPFKWFWTTYRWPFQDKTRICYPSHVRDPMSRLDVLEHELFHVKVAAKWWGPFFHALTIIPGFRFYIERWAMLNDIKKGRRTVDQTVGILWTDYQIDFMGIPSKHHMTKWFLEQLNVSD